ncbi:MAG: class I SAM-dependent methyltransferase [Phycisphaeraceae bacterium]|nr:class I SAM-dependent methyltransferase [Phycisphaeraceae bacterium]
MIAQRAPSRWLVDPSRFPAPAPYADRATKARYVADRFAQILRGRILDVGCDQRRLAAHLDSGAEYVGVDLAPGADVVLNLDREDLPFPDRTFDCVVCTDVLEHLDRAHRVFDELCRVGSDRIVISLPNPARNFANALFAGRRGRLKFYGLPVEPPEDRHRWLFGFDDAAEFVTTRACACGYAVEFLDAEDVGCVYWMGRDGLDVLDDPNLTHGTLWSVLRRKDAVME